MNREASAPEASASRGSSFVITTMRVGSRPVHWLAILAVDRQAVLARDAQQALHDRAAI